MKSELLIGCGNSREKRMCVQGQEKVWESLTTLDINPDCKPDIEHNLEVFPYPIADSTFDEVHAYEVLEHTGVQGDAHFFFQQFGELHRILKPDGFLFASVPMWNKIWAWGDPSHKRVISRASLTFLSQEAYTIQVGKTPMTDFRYIWKRDFPCVWVEEKGDSMHFVLEARK